MTRLLDTRLCFALLANLVLAGCERAQAPPPPPGTPEVQVSHPVTRQVRDYEDFPGRMEAVNSIDVRARVSGYLEKMLFREGADVKQGDVLFEIDARPYKAELARAEANVVQAQAHLKRLTSEYERAANLLPRGAIGREEYDKTAGDKAEADAGVGVAKAVRDLAQLNVHYTQARAPISGRITRRNIDPGNMVKADDTPLATIVSLDPIYAYFDLDERTTLWLQRLIRDKKIQWSTEIGLPVLLGLADEDGFPRQGVINYADPRVDPETGTWRLRGLFKNPTHELAPGQYVRVRLPIGQPYQALLVSEQALATDQGQKYLYVVGKGNVAEYRRITVGRLHDGLRVVTGKLSPGEMVVVSGLQRIHDKSPVDPKPVPMPVPSASAASIDKSKTGSGTEQKPAGLDKPTGK